jgi:GAF domain-containing protein
VSLIDETSQIPPGEIGHSEDRGEARPASRGTPACSQVSALGESVIIEDITKDERFADDPFFLEKGIRFYAGAPLRTASGTVLGALCVIDTKPRQFGDRDRKLLQLIADELMGEVEAESQRQDDRPVLTLAGKT